MVDRKRKLSDSEARWEAVNLIAAATDAALCSGGLLEEVERNGWTWNDGLAIERHARARVSGLIRRPRKVG